MKDLKSIKELVRSILERDENARNNDNYLYLRVLQETAKNKVLPHPHDITMELFLLKMSDWGFPPFESVRRTRQKVQEECSWLAPCKKVEELRAENEEAYRAFARS